MKNKYSLKNNSRYFKRRQRVCGFVQQTSLIQKKILPVTSCCPARPTGTIPRLFIAVAQAVGSVTDMFSCVVSIAILPKPSAAAGEETCQCDSIFNKVFNENEISQALFCFLIMVHLSEISDNTAWQIIKILETFNRHGMKHEWFKLLI